MLPPMVLALTRTSPSPGCGVGTSTYSSADGSPGRRSRMAFIGSDLDQLSAMIGLRKTPMPPSISTSTTRLHPQGRFAREADPFRRAGRYHVAGDERRPVRVLLLLALLPARREFYLSTSPPSQQYAFGWFVAIAVVLAAAFWLGLFSYKHLDDAEWWRFTLHDNASRFLRASIAVAIVALGAAAYRSLSAVRYRRTAVRR
jgi:hypothetical protein